MKTLKLLNKKNLSIIIISLLSTFSTIAEDKPVDIWNIDKKEAETSAEKSISEEKITLKVLKINLTVISLGGGAFINKVIRKEVLKNHISFWLNWNTETLLNRIKNSKKRPIAFNSNENELIDLIEKRSNIYSRALHEIKCDKLSKNEIVKKVLKNYEAN